MRFLACLLLALPCFTTNLPAQNQDQPVPSLPAPDTDAADNAAILIPANLVPSSPVLDEAPPVELREVFSWGKPVTVPRDKTNGPVIVFFSDATIEGTVAGDVFVIGGSLKLKGNVQGTAVSLFGGADLDDGSKVARSIWIIGGEGEIHPGAEIATGTYRWLAGPQWPERFESFVDWVREGLLLGRLLPLHRGWWWSVAGLFSLLYVLLVLIFPRPCAACRRAMEDRPVTSFFVGILFCLLLAPLYLLLIASIIGIVILPFVVAAVVVGFLFGRVAVFSFAGSRLAAAVGLRADAHPVFGVLIGVALFTLLFAVPVVGILAWGFVFPFGMGGVVVAFFRGFRSEAPVQQRTPLNPTPAGLPAPSLETPALPADGLLLPKAGFWRRLAALILDLFLFSCLVFLTRHFVWFVLLPVYFIAMWGWRGTTIGGIIMGLRIIKTDGRPIGFGDAIIRGLSSLFSGAFLLLGFLWTAWDRQKQAWHDKIAGTFVVRSAGTPLL